MGSQARGSVLWLILFIRYIIAFLSRDFPDEKLGFASRAPYCLHGS
jgi:hypothetical protein